jgi:hypothetical protein
MIRLKGTKKGWLQKDILRKKVLIFMRFFHELLILFNSSCVSISCIT